MKPGISFLILLFLAFTAAAQDTLKLTGEQPAGSSHSISLEVIIPFGEFNETNGIGAGLRYEHSGKRYGRLEKLPSKRFGFIYGAGIGWHDGKDVPVALVYSYHYGDFMYGYLFGGGNFLPCRNGNISISAGPAMSIYKSNSRFNLYAGINGAYYPWERFGIGAGFRFLKEDDAAWMAMGAISGKFIF